MSTADVLVMKGKTKGEGVASLPLQETSLDIWDKKYRLKTKDGTPVDGSVDETLARASHGPWADVEADEAAREHWHEEFLWALRQGAIPAGRITSNAGALAHKARHLDDQLQPSRAPIVDSMDDILSKVHEAGLTLKAGCGASGMTSRPCARVVRTSLGGRRLHVRPAVVHGYLRQDVLHRVVRRWAGAARRMGTFEMCATRTCSSTSRRSARTGGFASSTCPC